MKAQRKIRSLLKIETFEDIVLAVRQGIFPMHLFKMVEAAGEKCPLAIYKRAMRRCYVASVFFSYLFIILMAVAATMIYQNRSIESLAFGVGLLILVMLLVLSDMLPHVPTTRRCVEERFAPFVAFFKELYGRSEITEGKLDEESLREQVRLAKLMGVIPKDADMRHYIIQTAIFT